MLFYSGWYKEFNKYCTLLLNSLLQRSLEKALGIIIMLKNESLERKVTVTSYSEMGSQAYDDPMNLGFLYGKVTADFLNSLPFATSNETLLDIGCGTGLGFDVLREKLEAQEMNCVGIEPASGMLDIAKIKYKNSTHYSFFPGSFENIPLESNSVDRIISTLALHWVKDFDIALAEMRRVLKDEGRLDILMIAKNDGAQFKKAIVAAQKKHLTFSQIMDTAALVQRLTPTVGQAAFKKHFKGFDVNVSEHRSIINATFDEHMKWWQARSSPVIAEVKDKKLFFDDLRIEMDKAKVNGKIPFDSAFLFITVLGK